MVDGRDEKGHFIKGFHHNKGIVRSDSQKEKIRATLAGRKATQETKLNKI